MRICRRSEIERSKPINDATVRSLRIPDRQNDCVALVALHPFEVLHKRPLRTCLVKESGHFLRLLLELGMEGSLDSVRVVNRHSDYPEGLIRRLASVINHQIHDSCDLVIV